MKYLERSQAQGLQTIKALWALGGVGRGVWGGMFAFKLQTSDKKSEFKSWLSHSLEEVRGVP